MGASNQGICIVGSLLMPQEEILEKILKRKSFRIGIPADFSGLEHRVPLTPLAIELLVKSGFKVLIEKGAGKGAHFTDLEYSEAGAEVTTNKADIFSADIIIKIDSLTLDEVEMLRGNQLVISSLNYNRQEKRYFERLIEKKVTAISFENMLDHKGENQIVRSMSEIAGRSSVLIASEYLSNIHNGKGEMFGGITGVAPTQVVIIGAGVVGTSAAIAATALGASIQVFDDSIEKLEGLQNKLGQKVYTSTIHSKHLSNSLLNADVVIAALRSSNKISNLIISEEMVKKMKKNSIIIDISIDQGGIVESSVQTSHKDPVFIKHGVIHYCVPNIASRVARTASYAVSNMLLEELLKVHETCDIVQYIRNNMGIRKGTYLLKGILCDADLGKKHGLGSKDINLLLSVI